MSDPVNSDLNRQESEVSLVDILRFLRDAYKAIVIAGVAGLGISVIYLAIAPKQYEAVAQVAMAQIGAASNNNGLNAPGINIEEPSLLIARLSQPTSFPADVLSACGIEEGDNTVAMLSKSIKLVPSKGVANLVELKTYGASPEAALTCAKAIFWLIKTTQAQIAFPYIEEAKLKLADDSERLAKAREFIVKADKSGSPMGTAYLLTRDEIRFLLDEIAVLKNVITSDQSRATRLLAPIYASHTPIAPKKRIVLMAGLLGGVFLGLLLALVRRMWIKLKAGAQDQGRGA